jgi:hypothetical protein
MKIEGDTMQVQVGDRVKVVANGSFELPMIIEVRTGDIVLQRRKKKGKLTISKTKFYELDKSFRGVKYECVVTSKI